MKDCRICGGEGVIDCRDEDAMIAERWTEAEIAEACAAGMMHPVGVVQCEVCDGTGKVSEEKDAELLALESDLLERAFEKFRERGFMR